VRADRGASIAADCGNGAREEALSIDGAGLSRMTFPMARLARLAMCDHRHGGGRLCFFCLPLRPPAKLTKAQVCDLIEIKRPLLTMIVSMGRAR